MNVPIFFLISLSFPDDHGAILSGISLVSARLSCPGCVPSLFFIPPQTPHGGVGKGAEKALALCELC